VRSPITFSRSSGYHQRRCASVRPHRRYLPPRASWAAASDHRHRGAALARCQRGRSMPHCLFPTTNTHHLPEHAHAFQFLGFPATGLRLSARPLRRDSGSIATTKRRQKMPAPRRRVRPRHRRRERQIFLYRADRIERPARPRPRVNAPARCSSSPVSSDGAGQAHRAVAVCASISAVEYNEIRQPAC